MSTGVDEIRNSTLKQIEKTESNYRLAFIGAAVVEAAFLAAFLLLADFSNRTHVLLFITTMAVYMIVGAGLFALGMHVSRNTLRVLQAIEILGDKD